MTIAADVQSLVPGNLITLYELDTTAVGDPTVYRFHPGVNAMGNDVTWGGNIYTRFPIEASGFERAGQGRMPRPRLAVANVDGLVGALAASLGGLEGARLTRIRTFLKYLDAINFEGGVNASADPNQVLDREIWVVARKSAENKVFVEFELAASIDMPGVMLPRRQVIANVCTWRYRSAECGYSGGAVADRNDIAVGDLALDVCGRRLTSCKLRFGAYAELPFGGFPAAGLFR